MPVELTLTIEEARFISLVAQRLEGAAPRGRRKPTKADVLDTIRALGCVQLDTISVVARSHETVLWSRLGEYDPALILELHYPDRALIEYWVHAAAIAPAEMFPYLRRFMQNRHHDEPGNVDGWEVQNRELVLRVLAAIETNGPMASRDFERTAEVNASPWAWYGGKPEKQALDALWTAGELAVQQRIGFQRIYDLTDRAFPGMRDEPLPSLEAQQRFFVSTALRAMGVAASRWVTDYFRGGKAHVSAANAILELRALETEGMAIAVAIEGLKGPFWLDPTAMPILDAMRQGEVRAKRTTLLSPFDSLIWNRDRALTLFNFDYRIEVYTPAEKRRYGYYSLAILHRGRLVGRLDPVYKRQQKRLFLNSIHLEPGIHATGALTRSVAKSIRSYLDFLGGGSIEASGGGNVNFMAMLKAEFATADQ